MPLWIGSRPFFQVCLCRRPGFCLPGPSNHGVPAFVCFQRLSHAHPKTLLHIPSHWWEADTDILTLSWVTIGCL